MSAVKLAPKPVLPKRKPLSRLMPWHRPPWVQIAERARRLK